MQPDDLAQLVTDPAALRRQGRCVIEGTEAVRQLLRSACAVELVLAVPGRAADLGTHWAEQSRQGQLLAMPRPEISRLLGRRFLRGALAVARRPIQPTLDSLLVALPATAPFAGIVLDAIADPANVGSIVRSARCLGLQALLLGPGCADPFYRQALRTGMGHAFHLPVIACPDLPAALRSCAHAGIPALAAALDGEDHLKHRPSRWLLVVGNEDLGVSPRVRAACAGALRIPMATGCDSLSVSMAAAILADRLRR